MATIKVKSYVNFYSCTDTEALHYVQVILSHWVKAREKEIRYREHDRFMQSVSKRAGIAGQEIIGGLIRGMEQDGRK